MKRLSSVDYYAQRYALLKSAMDSIKDFISSHSETYLIEKAILELTIPRLDEDAIYAESAHTMLEKEDRYRRIVYEHNSALSIVQSAIGDKNNPTDSCDYREKCLFAYREFLQDMDEEFTKCHDDYQHSIFTISYDLTRGRTRMITLFSDRRNNRPAMCAVFMPSDMDAAKAFKYLPTLVHEASHNFMYIERSERNGQVISYLLNRLARDFIRNLIEIVPEAAYSLNISQQNAVLTSAVQTAFRKCIPEDVFEDIINRARLTEIPSILTSTIFSNVKPIGDWIDPSGEQVSFEKVLSMSFIELISLSGQPPVGCTTDSIDDDNVLNNAAMSSLLNGKPVSVLDVSQVKAAFMVISKRCIECLIREACDNDLLEIIGFNKNDGDATEQMLKNMYGNEAEFQSFLATVIQKSQKQQMRPERITALINLLDSVIRIRTNCTNILYVCQLCGDGEIPLTTDKSSELGEIIFSHLHDGIQSVLKYNIYNIDGLEDKTHGILNKIYYSSKKNHAALVKLGLLEENSSIFLVHFDKMMKIWTKTRIVTLMNEYMQVYREIFADLGMCAVFSFNHVGYRNFMNLHSMYTPERLNTEIMMDRIDTVERVLKMASGMKVVSGEFDKMYLTIYKSSVAGSAWAKTMHETEIASQIGIYYNGADTNMDTDGIEAEFVSTYYEKYRQKQLWANANENENGVLKIVLGDYGD